MLKALAHPIRREILWLVWDRALPVRDIGARFAVAGPTISEHLRVLREAELVEVHRQGTVRAYQTRREALGSLAGVIAAGRPARLRRPPSPEATPDAPVAKVTPTQALSATVVVPAPLPAVFAHWTTPALMEAWIGTDAFCDPEDGGVFAFTSFYGVMVRGVYEAVVPPRLLVFRWDAAEAQVPVPSSELGPTFVVLSEADGGTQVAVTQIVHAAPVAQFLAGAWSESLALLQEVLAAEGEAAG